MKSATQEFCDWVESLGGTENNIEESTITSLFASGYETKPALSVPIHVVELANVPQELHMSATTVPALHPDLTARQLKQVFKCSFITQQCTNFYQSLHIHFLTL